ncbi:MAG: carboxypeptidase regulatory-like domain-containing protein [Myxococcales bacterium]|nr:carboxypeptidase regulatory-like domain-containing protein [Myxococcales bacterium]
MVVAIVLLGGGRGHKGQQRRDGDGEHDPWAEAGAQQGPRRPLPNLANLPGALGLSMRKGGPPVTITGVVRLAPGGTPVADAEVAFMSDSGENTAMSDGSGRYEIKVASGIRWKVHARSEKAVGYPEAIEPAQDMVRDLEVHPTSIVKGRVIDPRGAAVPGATVAIEVAAADRGLLEAAMPLSTIADDAGRFELVSVPGDLTVRGLRGLAQGVAIVTALAPGDRIEVAITLNDPVTVNGRVVDGDGQPVAGAKILAAATISPGGPTDRLQFESDADGAFTARTPAGWLRLEARKDGDLSPAIAQWYNSGETRALVLTIAPPVALRGKVIAADGTPVVGARVRLSATAVYDTTSLGDGSFEVGAPAGQPYLVKVKHSDGYLERTVATWNGDETFVMRRFGALTVTVPTHQGEVAVTIDSFVPTGERSPRAPGERQFRGNGGQVTLTSLEPGVYDLTVAAAGAGATHLPRVVIDDGATRTVEVALAAPVPVRGVVKTGAQPVGGAQVTIAGRTTFSDAKGRWVIPDVAAGPAAIVVVKTGFGTAWASTTAAADGRPVEIELRPVDGAGQVDGIGIVVAPAPSGALVTAVLPGSPAEGKLVVGDVITEVDGADVATAAMDDIIARLRGSAGSSVSITVTRGADGATVDMVRRRLVVPVGTGAVAARAAAGGARC